METSMDRRLPAGLADRIDSAADWFAWATAQRPQSAYVEANGNRLHYLEWNAQKNARDDGKPVLLFVHGLRAHAHWWDFIAPFFMQSHRVIALDLSGMGESGWHAKYSAPQLALDVNCFIEALHLPAPTVVAHSYGGLCSLRAASMQPALFGRLVILDTFVIFEGETIALDPPRPGSGKTYPDRAAATLRYRLLPPQPEPAPFLLAHIAYHSMRETEGGVRWKFDPGLNGEDIHLYDGDAMLGKISVPVDYCYGESSALVDADHARRIVAALPKARGPIAIPDAHHHLLLDQPLALVAILEALLA